MTFADVHRRACGRWLGAIVGAIVGVALLALAGCSPNQRQGPALHVYAASSLADAFGELESAFERAHPEVEVALTLAGSQMLRLQIERGARADVFASADPGHMQALQEAGLVRDSQVVATNALVVIVPLDNPAGLTSFEGLPRASSLVLGAPGVPVGRYTDELMRRASERYGAGFAREVGARVVSLEGNVRLVRAKIELGQADAAVVYRTDAVSSSKVRALEIPADLNVEARYHLGIVQGGGQPSWARRWVDFVASPVGQEILARHGFGPGGR